MTPAPPALAVVVSTIGRPDGLRGLLQSISDSELATQTEVVVVDQSDDQKSAAVLLEQDWPMATRATTSPRGASIGRNAGLKLTSAPLVVFPDDDAWYPAGMLERMIDTVDVTPELAALCGRQIGSDGVSSMLRWQTDAGPVTDRNFLHTSIMSTMLFRRTWLDKAGPFDDNMGVGAPSWYGACEESDLLLRVIAVGGRVDYCPDLLVGQAETRDNADDAFVLKMLKYGCGQGHLWRKHRLSRSLLAYYLARKLFAACVRTVRGEHVLAKADLAWLRGNIAGLRDVAPAELRGTGR